MKLKCFFKIDPLGFQAGYIFFPNKPGIGINLSLSEGPYEIIGALVVFIDIFPVNSGAGEQNCGEHDENQDGACAFNQNLPRVSLDDVGDIRRHGIAHYQVVRFCEMAASDNEPDANERKDDGRDDYSALSGLVDGKRTLFIPRHSQSHILSR